MKTKLKDYTEGRLKYTPLMNIFMRGNRSKDYYTELGKYIHESFGDDLGNIPSLSFLASELKKNIITKIKDFITKDNGSISSSIGIFFLTSTLDEKALETLFGEPLYHNEFGEGFEGEYDEETDEYGEPDNKYRYASYFITIDGVNLHIGYDHRGTCIEVDPKSSPEKIFEVMKKLVDLYKEKVL